MIQQEHVEAGAETAEEGVDLGHLLMDHAADAYSLHFEPFPAIEWDPHLLEFQLAGMTINMTPTRHLIFMVLAAALVFLVMWRAGKRLEAQRAGENAPKGWANAVEGLVLWVRNDVAIENIGHDGAKFAPYIMSLFFFILFSNLMGLVPWADTPTSNLAVTVALAALSLVVIEVSGMIKLGFGGYMRTIFPKVEGISGPGAVVLSVALGPIEFMGKLVKPIALSIRLFGNMTAGHFVILAMFGIIFLFGHIEYARWAIGGASALLVLAIMMLEIIVAFVQAYVFTLITAVLIGIMQHEH
jgi:F-type H+-transporting ATPase subunit a